MARIDAAADRPEADGATVMFAMMGCVFPPFWPPSELAPHVRTNPTPAPRFNPSHSSPSSPGDRPAPVAVALPRATPPLSVKTI